MVRSSGIREKLRSNVLKELARERGTKRSKNDESISKEDISDSAKRRKDDNEDNDSSPADYYTELAASKQESSVKTTRTEKNSLLLMLPKPKNSSAFGPTIRLDKLLQLPERADDEQNVALMNINRTKIESEGGTKQSKLNQDGMVEVDVSKFVVEINTDSIKELTVEKTPYHPSVIVPKGKEKQKNQITYLAQLSKATELERKEQAAQSRFNKAAARSKYGW